jgi:2-haloacid dehalogenase
MEAMHIRALTFDVGGTVFRWRRPIAEAVRTLAAERGVEMEGEQFAFEWRAEMFRVLKEVREGRLQWMNGDRMHRIALDRVLQGYPGLVLSETEADDLNTIWHRLPAWDDFPPALQRMQQNYRTVVLTVMSFAMVVENSRAAGIRWDGVLSCEFLTAYKPDHRAYRQAVELLALAPGEVMMVASHTGDLIAAAEAGLATAYVAQRVEEPHSPLHPQETVLEGFDLRARDFTELADKLSR